MVDCKMVSYEMVSYEMVSYEMVNHEMVDHEMVDHELVDGWDHTLTSTNMIEKAITPPTKIMIMSDGEREEEMVDDIMG